MPLNNQQTVNIGTGPSTGDGDPLRVSFDKINQNFNDVYGNGYITQRSILTSVGTLGDVPGLKAIDNNYFYYCTGTYDGLTSIWKRVALSATPW